MTKAEAELADYKALFEVMKGALAAQGVEWTPAPHPVLHRLTDHQRRLVGALLRRPRDYLPAHEILKALPSRLEDDNRVPHIVVVHVRKIRRTLGDAAIEHRAGYGYRLGAQLLADLTAGDAPPQSTPE